MVKYHEITLKSTGDKLFAIPFGPVVAAKVLPAEYQNIDGMQKYMEEHLLVLITKMAEECVPKDKNPDFDPRDLGWDTATDFLTEIFAISGLKATDTAAVNKFREELARKGAGVVESTQRPTPPSTASRIQ